MPRRVALPVPSHPPWAPPFAPLAIQPTRRRVQDKVEKPGNSVSAAILGSLLDTQVPLERDTGAFEESTSSVKSEPHSQYTAFAALVIRGSTLWLESDSDLNGQNAG